MFMSKKHMIGLLAAVLFTVFIAETANAFTFRIQRSVDNIHDCLSNTDDCYGAKRVTDRLFGAEIVTVPDEETCAYIELNGKCYKPTCEMTGTLVCQSTEDQCGVVTNTQVGLTQDSFESEAYFNTVGTALGVTILEIEAGEFACRNASAGSYVDYLPYAIVAVSSYYKDDTTDSQFYEFVDVCPGVYDTDLGKTYDCTKVWASSAEYSTPRPHLACCGEQNTLTVDVTTEGGTVTSEPAGINCRKGSDTNDCSKLYGGSVAPYDGCPEVTLTATPDQGLSGYVFTGWDGGGCSGIGTCTPSLEGSTNTKVTATFEASYHTLTVIVEGDGTKDKAYIWDPRIDFDEPPEFYCTGLCTKQFEPGTQVILKRKGGTYDEWGGVCAGTPNDLDCTFVMESSLTAVAKFIN